MRDMTKEEIKSLDKEHVLHSWSVQGTLDPMVQLSLSESSRHNGRSDYIPT